MMSTGNELFNKPINLISNFTSTDEILFQNWISVSPVLIKEQRTMQTFLNFIADIGGFWVAAYAFFTLFHIYVERKLYTLSLV